MSRSLSECRACCARVSTCCARVFDPALSLTVRSPCREPSVRFQSGDLAVAGFVGVERPAPSETGRPAPSETWRPAPTVASVVTGLALALAALAGCGGSDSATQVEYPARPIKLIVPFSVGGGTDSFARIIKQSIDDNDLLPQPLVVINQGGAGATIGSRRVKDSTPDGYTLLILHDAIITAKYSGKVDYGPEAFEAVAGTGEMGMVLAVSEASPYHTLPELMEAVQREPNRLSFGANLGALTHFAGLQLEQLTPGARFRFAQIGGGAERFADLKGGHIDVTGFSIEEFARFRSEGLRGLAYFGHERHPAAPDVPTASEQGIEMFTGSMFYWWFPKGTPRAVCDRVADALEQAMQTDYVQGKMDDIHCEPTFLRGPELARQVALSTQDIAGVAPRETVPLPRTVELTLIALGILAVPVTVGGWRDFARRRAERRASRNDSPQPRYRLAWLSALVTVAYPAAMTWGVDFRVATFFFVLLLGSLLGRRRIARPEQQNVSTEPTPRRAGPLVSFAVLIAVAGLLSVGLHQLFTRLFVIDMP